MEALRILREATGNAELQMQTMVTFVYIAQRHPNEVPSGEIEKLLGIAQTTVSRNLQYLGKGQRDAKGNVVLGGYKLIETAEDPFYRKRKLSKLTTKGEGVAAKIAAALSF